jgi:hypothetical protein
MVTDLNAETIIKKEESPSPIITDFNSNLETSNKAIDNGNLIILTLDNILETALELSEGEKALGLSIYRLGKLRKCKTEAQKSLRLRIKPIYKDILNYIRQSEFFDNSLETPNWKSIYELCNHFSIIKPRTLRGYLKELQELKWLRRHGRDYHLNPFLFELFGLDEKLILLLEFSPYKIDLFQLLNLPLINAQKSTVKDVGIAYFDRKDERYYREVFSGIAIITLTLESGKAETILPVNLHAQYAKGKDINHYCIPLAWELFDIDRASYYSTNFKRSHHKGVVSKKNEFIHFDNSITIRYLPKSRFYMLWEKRHFEHKTTSLKHWQTGEYLEYDNLENLRILFNERFINGKRRLDLFNSLGMTYKPNDGRPKGSKNKPKKPKFEPKRIDIMAMLARDKGR